jgi:hypothetical protein
MLDNLERAFRELGDPVNLERAKIVSIWRESLGHDFDQAQVARTKAQQKVENAVKGAVIVAVIAGGFVGTEMIRNSKAIYDYCNEGRLTQHYGSRRWDASGLGIVTRHDLPPYINVLLDNHMWPCDTTKAASQSSPQS